MPTLIEKIFSSNTFIPHGHCYLWQSDLVWLHILSDSLIALAYYSIPLTLIYFVRKRKDLPFDWVFLLFSAFIISCGTTHIMEVWTLWHPTYWLSGILKAITALVSVYTAFTLVELMPLALELPSPAQLTIINQNLEQQIRDRQRAEAQIRQLNQELEAKVAQRTAELETSMAQVKDYVERIALIMDAAKMGSWDWDLKTQKITWSLYHEILWGYQPCNPERSYEEWACRVHPNDLARVEAAVQHSQATYSDFTEEYRIILDHNKVHWVIGYGRVSLDDKGEPLRMLGLVQNITERKQVEAEIQEFNRRWRSVLDNIQMLVIELNENGIVEYINPFFQKISQFTPEEVIGKHWVTHFTPQPISANLNDIFYEILNGQTPEYYVSPVLTKSGEERMIGWRISLLKDNSGHSIGMIAMGEDITEHYHLERMKSQFISTVSHELRTPLTTIQASLSLLHEKVIDPNSEEGETTINIATDGVDRLVRLVNDILDLERLRSGKIRVEKNYYNIQQIVNEAIWQIQELIKQANIEIKINISATAFSLYADKDRLIQVLINLLSNAIKFSPSDSQITLAVKTFMSTELTPLESIFVTQFSISDQGRGIPHQKLEAIFEPFQQVDASDSREKGGTGLGLAICRNIIEQHYGRIWVKSTLGQGSTFYFMIPTDPLEASFESTF